MKRKLKKIHRVILVLMFVSLYIVSFAMAVDLPFKIVERFDDLQDWKGTKIGDVTNSSDMPIKNDGSPSLWTYYSKWGGAKIGPDNWIDDFGPGTCIGDTGKSLRIDLQNIDGPSRLGIYFGDGKPTSGEQDLYVFWRVKISGTTWPKDEDGHYIWWASWKTASISHGFTDVASWNYDTSIYSPYGNFAFVPHIKRQGTLNAPAHVFEQVDYESRWRSGDTWATAGNTVGAIYDDWMGYEMHLKLVPGSENGTVEIWQYDREGTAMLLYQNTNRRLRNNSVSAGHLYNKFFLGGNNSNSYSWTDDMQSWYYVDDFIIHSSRIGPTYFALLSGEKTSLDIKPKNPKATVGGN
jgi:hypothetical protein